jgi:hypothetical protein
LHPIEASYWDEWKSRRINSMLHSVKCIYQTLISARRVPCSETKILLENTDVILSFISNKISPFFYIQNNIIIIRYAGIILFNVPQLRPKCFMKQNLRGNWSIIYKC